MDDQSNSNMTGGGSEALINCSYREIVGFILYQFYLHPPKRQKNKTPNSSYTQPYSCIHIPRRTKIKSAFQNKHSPSPKFCANIFQRKIFLILAPHSINEPKLCSSPLYYVVLYSSSYDSLISFIPKSISVVPFISTWIEIRQRKVHRERIIANVPLKNL